MRKILHYHWLLVAGVPPPCIIAYNHRRPDTYSSFCIRTWYFIQILLPVPCVTWSSSVTTTLCSSLHLHRALRMFSTLIVDPDDTHRQTQTTQDHKIISWKTKQNKYIFTNINNNLEPETNIFVQFMTSYRTASRTHTHKPSPPLQIRRKVWVYLLVRVLQCLSILSSVFASGFFWRFFFFFFNPSLPEIPRSAQILPDPLAEPGRGDPLWLRVQLVDQPAQLVEGLVLVCVHDGGIEVVTEIVLHLPGLLDHLLQLLWLWNQTMRHLANMTECCTKTSHWGTGLHRCTLDTFGVLPWAASRIRSRSWEGGAMKMT